MMKGVKEMEEKKKFFSKADCSVIAICLGVSTLMFVFLFIVLITVVDSTATLNSFKIDSFNMETESTNYTYSDNYITYSGTGVITCTDVTHNYYVLLQQADRANGTIEQNIALVVNGTGEFTTYNTSLSGSNQKPDYEFRILGFIPFET